MIDFSKKRFLVVDDFSEFRSSIRGILNLLGVQHIDTAANGIDVLELCRRHRYDVILHDYNLGDGFNGQQVLEQLHAEKLISAHCIFIMVTAENTQAMVLAALECEPDDYLTKPFNKVTLQTRLERLIRRKQVLAPVLKALEADDPLTVLQTCRAIAQQEPRHAVLCHRYMADALQVLGRYLELEQLLEQQARSRPTGWNLQALAKLWLHQGRLDQVTRLLAAAVRQLPMMPEFRDMQAELAAIRNDQPTALDALQQAVILSPNTLRRQIKLASQAWLNGDIQTAQHALRQCWEIGRHSVSFDPELLWQLASILSQTTTSNKLPDEAQQWLGIIEKNYRQSLLIQPAAALLRLEEQRRKGTARDADDVQALLHTLLENKYDYAAMTLIQLGDWLALHGNSEDAQSLWQFCAQRYAGTFAILQAISTRLPSLAVEPLQHALELSRQAAALHFQEQGEQAQALFEQALALAPDMIELNMAAARLFQDQFKHQLAGAEKRLDACLQRIGSLPKIDPDAADFIHMQSSLELSPW